MAIVVVGGHTRNIGKTSVVAGIIAALPAFSWTAFKITQFGHGICSANGEACDCDTGDHTVAISEEREGASTTDSARYLAAGAVRSWWVRTRQGQLADAMPRLRAELARAENSIVESNSILRFIRPDLYLSVLDPAEADFKDSARRYLDRADAVLVPEGDLGRPAWKQISLRLIAKTPILPMRAPVYVTPEIVSFVESRIGLWQSREERIWSRGNAGKDGAADFARDFRERRRHGGRLCISRLSVPTGKCFDPLPRS